MFTVEIDNDFLTELGVKRKDHVVRFLKRNFKIKQDYDYEIVGSTKSVGRGGQNKELYYMTQEAAELLKNTYNMRNRYVTKVADTNVKCIVMSIENSTIGFLCNCLKSSGLTLQRQKRIGTYYIDLYIEELKLCVECDENGHKYYNSDKEIEREVFIKDKLDCEFLRYNPHAEGFDMSDIIDKVFSLYINFTKNKYLH